MSTVSVGQGSIGEEVDRANVFDSLSVGRNYRVVVADPPWQYQKNPGAKGGGQGANGIAEREYSTMTNEEISTLPVASLVAPDAHLFLWMTNPGIYGGRFSTVTPRDIAESWGFQYKTTLTWVKTAQSGEPIRSGMGWFFRGCTEHIMYATRGAAGIAPARREPNVIMAPRGRHSQKPEEFMQMVERVVDGPYLELFARERRPGWDAWGLEIEPPPHLDDLIPPEERDTMNRDLAEMARRRRQAESEAANWPMS